MNRTRKLVLSAVAGVLSLSIVGVAAPGAHADTSWGRGVAPHSAGR